MHLRWNDLRFVCANCSGRHGQHRLFQQKSQRPSLLAAYYQCGLHRSGEAGCKGCRRARRSPSRHMRLLVCAADISRLNFINPRGSKCEYNFLRSIPFNKPSLEGVYGHFARPASLAAQVTAPTDRYAHIARSVSACGLIANHGAGND